MSKKYWLFAAGAVAALMTNQGGAQAQAQDARAQEDNEIVVTATRRDTALQDVPVAVTPVTAEMIQNAGIRDIQDLQSVAPALQFNVSESNASATARLRGVGTQGSNPGLESSVGVIIDGVFRARNAVAFGDLGEVSQIEVLRGPQGTLFGKNTSAGLINVVSAGPDLDDFGASAELTAGNYGHYRVGGHVNVPLIEGQMAARVYAATSKRDGFMELTNKTGGTQEVNNQDFWTVRGQLAWEPTNDLSLRFIADYTDRDEACCGAKFYNPRLYNGNAGNPFTFPTTTMSLAAGAIPGTTNLNAFGPGTPADQLARVGRNGGNIDKEDDRFGFADQKVVNLATDWGLSGELNWEIGDVKFTSVTSFRNWEFEGGGDRDFSAADIWRTPQRFNNQYANGSQFETTSQEFRFNGDLDIGAFGSVDWLAGVYYSREILERHERIEFGAEYVPYTMSLLNLTNPTLATLTTAQRAGVVTTLSGALAGAAGRGSFDTYRQEATTTALFTHNIWAIDDKTDVTLGFRYTMDEKTLKGNFLTEFNGVTALLGSQTAVVNSLVTNGLTVGQAATATAGILLAPVPPGGTNATNFFANPWLRAALDPLGYNQERQEDEWSGVVSVRRALTDDVSGYISVSRGYKAGGFNLDRNFATIGADFVTPIPGTRPDTRFPAEFVDSYEVGLKSNIDGLIFNIAAYSNEFENFQLNTFDGIAFRVSSLPKVTSQGVEVDMIWRTPVEGLSYQGGVSYNETEYGNWPAGLTPNPYTAPGQNVAGRRLTNAPLWTTSHSFTYEKPMFNDTMNGLAYLDFRYESAQVTGSDLAPSKIRPGNLTINGRLGLSTADEKLSFELWGKNLTNETHAQIAFDVPLYAGTLAAFLNEPRTYGATVRWSY